MGGRIGTGVGRGGNSNLKSGTLTSAVDWGRRNQIAVEYGEFKTEGDVTGVDRQTKQKIYIDVPEEVRTSKDEKAAAAIIRKELESRGIRIPPDEKINFSS